MQKSIEEILQRFLRHGDSDDVGLWQIINAVSGSLALDVRKMTLQEAEKLWTGMSELITCMLKNGFIAVDLTKGDGYGYAAWSEQEPKQVLSVIKNKWVALQGRMPDVGLIVWFHKVKSGV